MADPSELAHRSYRELVDLDGTAPGRIQVVEPDTPNGYWVLRAAYGFADRILATCAYERDAVALGRALADALGPECHFDGAEVTRA